MKNSNLVTYFTTALSGWFWLKNNSDCQTFNKNQQSDYPVELFKKNFRIKPQEIILFGRDTSSWNINDQGLVITNVGIYRIENNNRPDNIQFIPWADIQDVQYNKKLSVFLFKLKGRKPITIVSYEFFKKRDLDSWVCPLLAKYLVKLASLDDKRNNDKDSKEPQIAIERTCPSCGGIIETITLTHDNWNSFDGHGRIYGNPFIVDQHLDMLTWYTIIDRQLLVIEDLNEAPIVLMAGSDSFSHKRCKKCDHVWDMLDETNAILSSNNETLIQKYTFYIEEMNYSSNKEDRWIMSLIKSQLYCHEYLKQRNDKNSKNNEYYQSYSDTLKKMKRYHTKNTYLLSYEEKLRTEMSNSIQKFSFCDGIISASEFSENELKYIEAYYDFLVDGSISDSNRRKLERKRDSLGISKMEAGELEAILQIKLNENLKP